MDKVALLGAGMEVGVKELRDHLSKYLDRVKAGAEIVVTDHNRAIARLTALETPRALDRLIAAGLVQPARSKKRSRPKRLVDATGSVSELVDEQRR